MSRKQRLITDSTANAEYQFALFDAVKEGPYILAMIYPDLFYFATILPQLRYQIKKRMKAL